MSNFGEIPTSGKRKVQGAPKHKKREIKKIQKYLVVLIGVLAVVLKLFINLSPAFGSNPNKKQEKLYSSFENYKDGKFGNLPSTIAAGSVDSPSDSGKTDVENRPPGKLLIAEFDWNKIYGEEDSLTWLGHSAFILSLDNKKILIDPMLGTRASPVSFIGPKRYSEDLMAIIEELPPIDAVFITHDHYDHLDYQSIKGLKSKVVHFFVPYGVSNHLIQWGVAEGDVTELNWWDETEFQGLTVALTPAKHSSGRGILNQKSTLWGGWVILGDQTRFYTSGDSGYDGHFKEIGDRYGPFDIALIEGGQYDKRWPDSHMIPEESVQASIDVQGEQMMLTHWGAFTLARHGWAEPVERASAAASKKDVDLIAPQIGGTVPMDGKLTVTSSAWWK